MVLVQLVAEVLKDGQDCRSLCVGHTCVFRMQLEWLTFPVAFGAHLAKSWRLLS
jgi:hypothetical protein